jgi:hypothetical protein
MRAVRFARKVGAIALLMPILVYVNEPRWSAYRLFWPAVRFYAPKFLAETLFVALAYLLLRYSLTTPNPENSEERAGRTDRFFKKVAFASGAVAMFSVAAELCFAGVEIWSIREDFPHGPGQSWHCDWISLWNANTNSPVFWFLALVVFISGFYWEHRRSRLNENK